MNKIEKMKPDCWIEEIEEWKKESEQILRLLKKEYNRKTKIQSEQNKIPRIYGSISNGKPQFFHLEKKDKKYIRKYIPKSQINNVKTQLQNEYSESTIKKLEENIALIDRFLNKYKQNRAWTYFDTLPTAKKQLISPVFLTDKDYILKWQSESYNPKEFAQDSPKHFTAHGERVRSKSEVIIADTLMQFGIPYKYEVPLQLENIIVHPDFCCLNIKTRQEIFWEHLGMMDDIEYVNRNCQKLHKYNECGYYLGSDLIISWETSNTPLNKDDVEKLIRKYFY